MGRLLERTGRVGTVSHIDYAYDEAISRLISRHSVALSYCKTQAERDAVYATFDVEIAALRAAYVRGDLDETAF